MKRWGIISALLMCLALVSLPACGQSEDESGVNEQSDGTVNVDPQVAVSGSGAIAAYNDRNLAFDVAGKIYKMYVEEGDTVSKGDALAKLDTTALELALAKAEADLVQVLAAQAQAEAASEQADYELHQFKDVLHASSDRVKVAESQLEAAEKALEAANLQVQVAGQAVTEARKQLGEATLAAPFGGEVATVYANEGDSIANGTTIIRLVDPTSLQLIARISELDVVNIKTEQKVIISVEALPGTVIEGSVTFISPVDRDPGAILFESDDEEKEYEVKIGFDIPENSPIRVGMNATAEIIIE
jgi:RND family efflux transporter MFP subunit